MEHTGDRKQLRAKEKQAKIDARERDGVLRELMATAAGRAWVWQLLCRCHIFGTTFTGEALTSAFAEGERNIGQMLLNDVIGVCPDQYIQAMREANERSTLDEQRRSTDADWRDSGSGDAGGGDDTGD